jgi:hypothetical protein
MRSKVAPFTIAVFASQQKTFIFYLHPAKVCATLYPMFSDLPYTCAHCGNDILDASKVAKGKDFMFCCRSCSGKFGKHLPSAKRDMLLSWWWRAMHGDDDRTSNRSCCSFNSLGFNIPRSAPIEWGLYLQKRELMKADESFANLAAHMGMHPSDFFAQDPEGYSHFRSLKNNLRNSMPAGMTVEDFFAQEPEAYSDYPDLKNSIIELWGHRSSVAVLAD